MLQENRKRKKTRIMRIIIRSKICEGAGHIIIRNGLNHRRWIWWPLITETKAGEIIIWHRR